MTDLVETFDLEKESLEDEYNELSLQYEGYKFSVGNDSLLPYYLRSKQRYNVYWKNCVR